LDTATTVSDMNVPGDRLHQLTGELRAFWSVKVDKNFRIVFRCVSEVNWKKFFPDQPFEYNFLDESFDQLYRADVKTSKLMEVFTSIAIILSCLGLFGLAAFAAEQRTKEIGIRKVLGADIKNILALLSRDFVKLVAVALLIASPIAAWAMNKWLQDFAYRIEIRWWMFFMAGGISLLIALLSISFHSIKAAITTPLKTLRSE
jgi:putative ABC transport system permease protein